MVDDARRRLGTAGVQVDDYLRRVKETLEETAQQRERVAEEQRGAQRDRARAEVEAARREKERARIFREELQAAVERYDKALKEQLRIVRDKALRRKLEREGSRRRDRIQGSMERELGKRFEPGKAESFTPPKEVAPGDRVRIPSLGQSGVVETAAAPDRIRVQVAGKTLNVALADLVLPLFVPPFRRSSFLANSASVCSPRISSTAARTMVRRRPCPNSSASRRALPIGCRVRRARPQRTA